MAENLTLEERKKLEREAALWEQKAAALRAGRKNVRATHAEQEALKIRARLGEVEL